MLSSKLFLFHGQTDDWLKQEGNELIIRFLCNDPTKMIHSCFVRCEPNNEDRLIQCEKIKLSFLSDFGVIYQARIPLSTHVDNTYYAIKCLTDKNQIWLSAAGTVNRVPGLESHFKYNAQHRPPQWVQSQVFYQIFPDRFCQGNPDIAVKTDEYLYQNGEHRVIAKKWGEPVAQAGHQSTGASEFYGGDLKGIANKLDYLQHLGISVLYLNPIFTSPSNHKYDTTDYLNIDPHFGSNTEFAQLTDNLHQRGMKIILDAVFNHTSYEHPWFGRYQADEHSAYKHPDSPYRDHYIFTQQSSHEEECDEEGSNVEERYITWNGIDTLPKLNFLNHDVQHYIYKGESSVLKYWLKPPYHIDGWRFDVIHMLGEGVGAYNNTHYVKSFRASAKAVNPEAYIVGEHFYEATQWLQGEQEDGAMNYYGFAHPIRAFFAGLDIAYHAIDINAQELDIWLAESRGKIPWLNQLAQLNQLDSHDTMRFLTQLAGDQQRLKAASMLLFSYPGVPCLYYGTEVALQGGQDPDNRRCFPWNELDINSELFIFYQQLIVLRKNRKELQVGSYLTLYAENKCFVFARHYQGECTIYAVNLNKNSDQDKSEKLSQKNEEIKLDVLNLITKAQLFSGFDSLYQQLQCKVNNQKLILNLPFNYALLLSSQNSH
ncbi:maltodextrin glucosidase [Psychromonas arctica]|uniref:Maltodextrin glucosidase n=1 Tax=Psychromonas arctica TaxID=168275 RepID=A0ABU9H840_9GAMM